MGPRCHSQGYFSHRAARPAGIGVSNPLALSQVLLSPLQHWGDLRGKRGALYSTRDQVMQCRGKPKIGEAVSDLLLGSYCSQELNSSTSILTQQRWAGDKVSNSRCTSVGVSNLPLLSFIFHLLSSFCPSAVTGHPKQLNSTYFFLFLFLAAELSCVGQRLQALD